MFLFKCRTSYDSLCIFSDALNEDKTDALPEDILNVIKLAISHAEFDNFNECFRLFEEALKKAPSSPSILNDRAQALRLAGRDNGNVVIYYYLT